MERQYSYKSGSLRVRGSLQDYKQNTASYETDAEKALGCPGRLYSHRPG